MISPASKPAVTETEIGGTVYIVESVAAEDAERVIYDKLKRLIIHNAPLSESSKAS